MIKQRKTQWSTLAGSVLAALMCAPPAQADLNLSSVPLFLSPSVAPLNLLVVGRDHKLYYEAYNDASDLNGDGTIDFGYKGYLPAGSGGIDYYGYFDSYKCYTYAAALFAPVRETTTKSCGGAGEWSGDYLNYLTTSRIDALRKVLYGGKRSTDTSALTVLERSHIPMDAHSWGKEYTSIAFDGYDVRDYTPYSAPTGGLRHLFANTTPNTAAENWYDNNVAPLLRVLINVSYRKWEWVSKESPVAGTRITPIGAGTVTVAPADMVVRVSVCVTGLIGARNAENCRGYPDGNYKPTGLLHEFGENNAMLFGLLTGSYTANKSGGVLRKEISTLRNEINTGSNGTLTADVGIIRTLDRMRSAAYTRYIDSGADIGGTRYDCGLPAMAIGPPQDGNCRMWGNPVAEMMYEGLRYFSAMSPTPAFTAIYGGSNTDVETRLGLPRATTWTNPYQGKPVCSKPFETVMADINNSYDSDQLPGSVFPLETGSNAISSPLAGLNVATLADQITANEPGVTGLHFIGQSGTAIGSYDGAPTPKTVSSLSSIRGLAPEEPTKQGSYYAASVAYHGLTNDISSATGEQNVQTFAVALASPLPRIEIPVGGRTITLVPFAKSVVYGSDINRAQGAFQPTNQIVDFYIEDLAADRTSGTFQVNFEDVEAGNDHDMDAIVRYHYQVNGDNTVTVTLSSDYEAGSIIHHMGYVISGTSDDGVYLVVRDCDRSGATYTCAGTDVDYFLDTPPGFGPGDNPMDGASLPGFSTRTFSPGASGTAATLLKDPLWYAAKWGGFQDSDGDDLPDVQTEWDSDAVGTPGYGTPDNYFLVTNALTLSEQLREAFEEIIARTSSASSASVNSGSISTTTRVYQARFNTGDWTGQLLAFGVNPATGVVNDNPVWDASQELPDHNARQIITVNSDGTAVPFRLGNLDATRLNQLLVTTPADPARQAYLDYLRGDGSQEGRTTFYGLRERPSKLGDIVSSSPLFVGPPSSRYSDTLEAEPYSQYVANNRTRQAMVFAGANDGMLHGFNADTGRETFAFIPSAVFGNLAELVRPNYSHRYFVDGAVNSSDVFYNSAWHTMLVGGLNLGGQSIYALDISDPAQLSGAEGAAGSIFRWEFSDANDVDLGFTYSQPAIVRLHNGRWAAVFGNGYNNTVADGRASATGNAVLFIVDIETGALIRKFDTGQGTGQDPTGSNQPNGMSTPVLVDVDGDRIVDQAYAGDLFGNMWKFDLRATSAASWDFAFDDGSGPLPLFRATDGANAQPITVRPEVARGPYGAGVMVLFGTGKFLEPNDKLSTPTRVQSFYGLWDHNTYAPSDRITSRGSLLTQTITDERAIDPDGAGPRPSFNARFTSNTPLSGGSGWYLDLTAPPNPPGTYQGEKAVTDPLVRDDRVIFTTLIPDNNPCEFGGRSWLMVLDLLSGGRLPEAQLDTNGDGRVDENDEALSGVREDQILSRPEALLCLTGNCPADRLLSSGTREGELIEQALRSVGGSRGRQSWRQVR